MSIFHAGDFDTWFEMNCKGTKKEQAQKLYSFFDQFIFSPNEIYFDTDAQKEIPVSSRSLSCKSFEEILEKLTHYRQKYKTMLVYSVDIEEKSGECKVRFAGV
jgi:hypothetical protein